MNRHEITLQNGSKVLFVGSDKHIPVILDQHPGATVVSTYDDNEPISGRGSGTIILDDEEAPFGTGGWFIFDREGNQQEGLYTLGPDDTLTLAKLDEAYAAMKNTHIDWQTHHTFKLTPDRYENLKRLMNEPIKLLPEDQHSRPESKRGWYQRHNRTHRTRR